MSKQDKNEKTAPQQRWVDPDGANKTQVKKPPQTVSSAAGHHSIEVDKATDKTQFVRRPSRSSRDATRRVEKPATHFTDLSVDKQPDTASQSEVVQSTIQKTIPVLKDRFILEKILGSGGMGVVYKAQDKLKIEAQDRDPYVAIKVLNNEFKTHPDAFISLQRESRKTQRIAHPSIVNVFDFDRDGDTVFMTMEYLDGKPLDVLIKQYCATGLPTENAFKILSHLCSALEYAHDQQIIHSDFKPGNIFITKNGHAKVFDFGIARAVAATSLDLNTQDESDKTLFDAGTLGALTPAYASLEMLLGETPDPRDDIYALGCIAYELFTGKHPFNRLNAQAALEQGLKPARITTISKRQWQAIEQALAFKREDRIASVAQFHHLLRSKKNYGVAITASIAFVLLVATAGYFTYVTQPSEAFSEIDIRNELEYKIKLELYQSELQQLLKQANFTTEWEQQVQREILQLQALVDIAEQWLSPVEVTNLNQWFAGVRQTVYQRYIVEIDEQIQQRQYVAAEGLISRARQYAGELGLLDRRLASITQDKADRRATVPAPAGAKTTPATVVPASIPAPEKRADAKPLMPTKPRQVSSTVSAREQRQAFDVALNNVYERLQCQRSMNMRDLAVVVDKLKGIDRAAYQKVKPELAQLMAACITQIGKTAPARATDYQKSALRIFDNDARIAGLRIAQLDPCNLNIAGLGSRGRRSECRDDLNMADNRIGTGPALVVVPASGQQAAFAISRFEISRDEYNQYCKATSGCIPKNGIGNLPVTQISQRDVSRYLRWLNKTTKKQYRLPTELEWRYAADARQSRLDPNRNCNLSSRGIQKGQELLRVSVGQQNNWGLVNMIGNVQELVYARGKQLKAVGGSYQDDMQDCNVKTIRNHSGQADGYTGFRVVRNI